MPTIGFIGESGSPCIRFKLAGPNSPARDLDAIVDTGFTGFAYVPVVKAFPLGLEPCGTTNVLYADGRKAALRTAVGIANVEGIERRGVVMFQDSTDEVLVGMEFFQTFDLTLVLHRDVLFLLKESEANEFIQMDALTRLAPRRESGRLPATT